MLSVGKKQELTKHTNIVFGLKTDVPMKITAFKVQKYFPLNVLASKESIYWFWQFNMREEHKCADMLSVYVSVIYLYVCKRVNVAILTTVLVCDGNIK